FRTVVGVSFDDLTEVETQRAERRLPEDADARSGPQAEVVLDADQREVGVRVEFVGSIEHAQGAEIGEQRGVDAVLLGQFGRQGARRRADGIELPAQRVAELSVASADTGDLGSAESIPALVETIGDSDGDAGPAGDVSGGTCEAE